MNGPPGRLDGPRLSGRGVLRWLLLATHVPEGARGGGIVRYTVELASALAARPDVELTVLVMPAAEPFFAELLGPARVRTVPGLPTVAMSVLERYATPLLERGGPYDVVQGVKHLVPVRASGVRLLTVHDMLPFDRPQDFGVLKRSLLRGPYAASLRGADALVCVSAATRDRLVERLPAVGPRADVVPLAVSSALLAAAPEAVPSLRDRVFALAVGDPSPRKNIALLVHCWSAVVAQEPGAVLVLAGPPAWAASSYGAAFDELVASGSVVSLGRVPDAQLRWCYQRAAVVLCPSLLEGFGLPAVEALAHGAPLITSTDPALEEASGGAAQHVPVDRPDLWVQAVVGALRGRRPPGAGGPVRTWEQVAEETVAVARQRSSA